jgi:riboflavin biosynthesis pyrimidine reductase
VRSLIPAPSPGNAGEVDLDTAYAVPRPPDGTVFVRANFVAALDGAIALNGRSGGLGGDGDRRVFRLLRWHSDAVLVGARTAISENYGGVVVPPERRERRVAAGMAAVPPVAVVSVSLRFDPGGRLFEAAETRPLVITAERASADRRKELARVAEVVVCGDEAVTPAAALAALAERGLTRVLCEGGPALYTSIAAAGLLDELCLTVAPMLAGPGQPGITAGPAWPDPTELELLGALEEGGYLFLRYRSRRQAPAVGYDENADRR